MRVLLGLFAMVAVFSINGLAYAQPKPEFRAGFKLLDDQIPEIVGEPLEDERYDPVTDEARQRTTGGLLVWDKRRNATSFTDGYQTWSFAGSSHIISMINRPPTWWGQPTGGSWSTLYEGLVGSGRLRGPEGVALDAAGNVYVADTGNSRIQKFSSNGRPLARWGRQGQEAGQFDHPTGLALDAAGNIYVADSSNARVQKLSPSGQPMAVWGRTGSAPGEFARPAGVAVDGQGNVFVADTNNCRVQKLSPSGQFLAQWGSPGNGPGQFGKRPGLRGIVDYGLAGIAVDRGGHVYTADVINFRLQKFTSFGDLVTGWEGNGDGTGERGWQFARPRGVAVDSAGAVYVSERGLNRIRRLSASGQPIDLWNGVSGDGVASDPQGNLWIADAQANLVHKLSPSGESLLDIGAAAAEGFVRPSEVIVDREGHPYIVDAGDRTIKKLTPSGRDYPSGLLPPDSCCGFAAIDDAGIIYMTSRSGLLKLSPAGTVLARWGSEGRSRDEFNDITGLAVDGAGNVYVSDTNGLTGRVQKFTATGLWLATWSVGQWPASPVIDAQGNLYVAATDQQRVIKLAPDGKLVSSWGGGGLAPGRFYGLAAIAVDRDGNVYATDQFAHTIQQFAPSGEPLAWWGGEGIEEGEFERPDRIAVDRDGNVYVTDSESRRIQKLTQRQ